MSEFLHLADPKSVAESMAASAHIGGGTGERVKLTPEHMRNLMKEWVDPLDALFDKHRWLLYQTMELAAQQNQFEVEYTVQDDETADDSKLATLHQRLFRWAEKQGFSLRTSGRALRSFIVSWDPLVTPNSVTRNEAQNPHSVAARRIRAHRNNVNDTSNSNSPQRRTAGNSGVRASAFNPIGFLQNPMANLANIAEQQVYHHQQQLNENLTIHDDRIDQFAEYLAAPPTAPTSSKYSHLINTSSQQHLGQDDNSHLARRARAIASRAAAVAGEKGKTKPAETAAQSE